MPEYVEREALLAAYDKAHKGPPGRARKLIAEAPAADVAPVVHGRWIRYHEADLGWDEYGYRCSECKMEIEDKDFWDMFKKRCPNCGVRMDGDYDG